MATLIEILEMSIENIKMGGIGSKIGLAQVDQVKRLLSKGHTGDDDINDIDLESENCQIRIE